MESTALMQPLLSQNKVHVDLMMPAVKLATALEPLPTVSVIMAVTLEEIAAGTLTMFAPSLEDSVEMLDILTAALVENVLVYQKRPTATAIQSVASLGIAAMILMKFAQNLLLLLPPPAQAQVPLLPPPAQAQPLLSLLLLDQP